MKTSSMLFFLSISNFSYANTIEFDLSPPGTSPDVGLSPFNEVIPGISNGSGGVIGAGIFFDTSSLTLSISIGYGSSAGFADLTGPDFAWLLHGPGTTAETAPVLFSLAPLHTFGADAAQGGTIVGVLQYTPQEAADLFAGLDYINIYTGANPGGEIRAQLIPETVGVPDCGSTLVLLGLSILFVGGIAKFNPAPV